MTNKKTNRILIPILVVVIIFSVFKTIKTEKNELDLKAENNYVIGEITDHRISGMAETYTLYFKYNVNGNEYSKSVTNSFKYTDCEKNRECIGIKHIVYYDIDDPSNAFMDFNSTDLEYKKLNVKKYKLIN